MTALRVWKSALVSRFSKSFRRPSVQNHLVASVPIQSIQIKSSIREIEQNECANPDPGLIHIQEHETQKDKSEAKNPILEETVMVSQSHTLLRSVSPTTRSTDVNMDYVNHTNMNKSIDDMQINSRDISNSKTGENFNWSAKSTIIDLVHDKSVQVDWSNIVEFIIGKPIESSACENSVRSVHSSSSAYESMSTSSPPDLATLRPRLFEESRTKHQTPIKKLADRTDLKAAIPAPPILPAQWFGLNRQAQSMPDSPMPYNMKPKRTFTAAYRLKKACVSPLPKAQLHEKSVWVNLNEDQLLSEQFVRRLHRKFRIRGNDPNSAEMLSAVTSTIPSPASKYFLPISTTSDPNSRKQSISRSRTLNLVSAKASQSIAISMASAHLNPEQVAKCVWELRTVVQNLRSTSKLGEAEQCTEFSEQIVPEGLVETLIRNMPSMDAILKLSDCSVDMTSLIEADRLICLLSPLRYRIIAHLGALCLLLQFDSAVEQLKQGFRVASTCLIELKHSSSMPRLLGCALALVNCLNATSNAGEPFRRKPFVGFGVHNLIRLADTRDISNKKTLVHYLVEIMETNFSKSVHQWAEDMPSLDAAHSLYCAKIMEEKLVELKRDVARIEVDLQGIGYRPNYTSCDWLVPEHTLSPSKIFKANLSFGNVMSRFLKHATHEMTLVGQLHGMCTNQFKEVASYFAIDRTKYTADQLFADVIEFRDKYKRSWEDLKTNDYLKK